jgi:hypothetical protein
MNSPTTQEPAPVHGSLRAVVVEVKHREKNPPRLRPSEIPQFLVLPVTGEPVTVLETSTEVGGSVRRDLDVVDPASCKKIVEVALCFSLQEEDISLEDGRRGQGSCNVHRHRGKTPRSGKGDRQDD